MGFAARPAWRRSIARRCGASAARWPAASREHACWIGRDTRESGEWIEEELARGLVGQGARRSAGIVPTPAIAYLTRTAGFAAGIVISASHNPFEDNGIKVFSGTRREVHRSARSARSKGWCRSSWTVPADAPAPFDREDLSAGYLAHLGEIMRAAGPLAGSRVVIDCANGATASWGRTCSSPRASTSRRWASPPTDETSTCTADRRTWSRCVAVAAAAARLGIAFDGDGDRALFVDAAGRVVDGDAVLLLCALQLKAEGRLPGNAVVATVMSNIGLELALQAHGIGLVRMPVGDKYVMEEMLAKGLALGGEQSGHVIFASHLFTGDGLATALQVLRVMAATGRELGDLAGQLTSYPQVLVNVRVKERKDYMAVPSVASAIRDVEEKLQGDGRLLIRYSGTEPLLRIMLEGKHQDEIRAWAEQIASSVREHLA